MTGCLISLKTSNFGFLIFAQKSLIKMTVKLHVKIQLIIAL